ncbi:MAG TPA: FlgO family outer membrane protein, partial [candidate division Zixibacteria bacterium]|nr:FlgO family outer membrane protein [candidate division Zixibacteria bacterium]
FNPFQVEVTRQQTKAGASENSLAVMYFENIPDPEDKDHTGEMLTNLLITALFQTKGLEVISRERLYDIQKELGQAESKSITPSLATQIAQRAGVSMMLLGSILQQQPSLTVTFRLIEVKSGKILSTQRLTGFSAAQVFPLVDSLTALVQNDLKVSFPSASEKKSVAEVTTGSPEAYRSYLEGIELQKKAYTAEAEAAFKNAVELDSGFAMGYFRLFETGFAEAAARRKSLQKAWQLKGKVTEPERLQIEAAYVGRINNNASGEAKILEQLLQKYPHEQMVYERLAILYQNIFEYDKALQTLQGGLKNDSLDKRLWNALAYLQAGWKRKAEALASIDRYLRLAPAEPNPYDSKGDIYYLFGDLDSAEFWFQKAISLRGDFWSLYKLGDAALFRQDFDRAELYYRKSATSSERWMKWLSEAGTSFIYMHRGQYAQAKKQLLDILSPGRARESQEAIWSYPYLINLAYETGDYPAMLEYAKALSSEFRKDPDDVWYGRDFLAWAQLKNGNPKQGYKLLQELVRDVKAKGLPYQPGENFMRGLLAYEEGKNDAAVELFKKAFQPALPNRGPQYQYAVSLLKTGKLSEAIEEFSRLTRYPYFSGDHMRPFDLSLSPTWNYWPMAAAKAHFWLGVAYEQKGDTQEAIKEYEKFLDIWKNADPEIPEVADAKQRLEGLKKKV